MSLVSCIVPIYNVKGYAEKCIENLIMQSYSNIEIILVDDGSTDGSNKICDVYAKRDQRIRVIHKENGGLSSARNAGIDIATGDFLMFIDGDDYLATNAIEYLMRVMEESDSKIDLIQFRYKEVEYNEKVDLDDVINICKECYDTKEMFEQLYELGGVAASACTKLYRKHLFSDIRYPEGLLHEDEYVITDILERVNGVLYTDKILYYYVKRHGSIVNTGFTPRKMDVFTSISKRIQYFQEHGWSNLIQKEQKRYYMTLMNMYCQAYDANYKYECNEIKKQLNALLKNYSIRICGRLKIFEVLCRANVSFIMVYYWLKKITGKI